MPASAMGAPAMPQPASGAMVLPGMPQLAPAMVPQFVVPGFRPPAARENGLQVARLKAEFTTVVRPLMDLVDDLRDIGIDQDVSLPAIVVVGDQSTGKSSVLEAISGIDLPRGTGIVTRCPLEMRLRRKDATSEFHIQPGVLSNMAEVIPSSENVEEKVRAVQDRLAGKEKGISSKLITVTVKGADMPDLTLIDLPGIARVASEGQPADIEMKTKALIRSKISDEGTIILVVIPANVDIATIEALRMAQEVDPTSRRTLGVITKPDLIDRGAETELLEVLFNKKFHLDHGYTVVKCRNQAAVAGGLSLSKAMEEETEFFAQKLTEVPESQKGVPNLCKKLSKLLVDQIRSRLPQISNDVEMKLRKTQTERIEMGDGPPQDPQQVLIFVQQLTTKFLGSAKLLLDGQGESGDSNLYKNSRRAFSKYQKDIEKLVPALTDGKFLQEVSTTLNNERGRQLPGFMDYAVAEKKIRGIVDQMREPAQECMMSVSRDCHKTLLKVASTSYKGFDKLSNVMKQVVLECVEEQKRCCTQVLDHLFAIEKVVFSQDNLFQEAMQKVKEDKRQLGSTAVPNKQTMFQTSSGGFSFGSPAAAALVLSTPVKDAEECRDSIVAYLEICTRRIQDLIPLTVRHHMNTHLFSALEKRASIVATHQEVLTSLSENEDVASRRQYLLLQMTRLSAAQAKLQQYVHAD